MEKITVQNFSGIANAELEILPLTVFIGPQATGKSVLAKLLYFFRGVPMAVAAAADEAMTWGQFTERIKQRFVRFFPPSTWPQTSFRIVYARGESTISVNTSPHATTPSDGKLEISFEGHYQTLFEWLHVAETAVQGNDAEKSEDVSLQTRPREELCRQAIREHLGPSALFAQIFVTAARAFFSQVLASLFTQLREGGTLDPFVVEFGAFLEQTRSTLLQRGFYGDDENHENRPRSPVQRVGIRRLHETIGSVLRGKLIRTQTGDAILTPDQRTIPISLASSGQQEVLPLLLMLSRFYLLSRKTGRSIYIEEPEAHLFPTAQKDVVELMVETFNQRDSEIELVLTTHSPYVLTALNNLLKAGQRYAEADAGTAELLAKIIPKSRALALNKLAAYLLEDGRVSSIVDRETDLIDASAIDRVSELLAEEYHHILWEGK